MQPKKLPIRTCIACRGEHFKRDMLRIAKNAAGEISLDEAGKLPGRGAYCCRAAACLAKVKKYKLLNKAFHTEVPSEVYRRIEEEVLDER